MGYQEKKSPSRRPDGPFLRLPEKTAAQPKRKVAVVFRPKRLTVLINGDTYFQGDQADPPPNGIT